VQPFVVYDFVEEAVALCQACDPPVLTTIDRPPGVFATTDSTPPLQLPPPT
jgi:hypothetical protein